MGIADQIRVTLRAGIDESRLSTIVVGDWRSFKSLSSLLPAVFIKVISQSWRIASTSHFDVDQKIEIIYITDSREGWEQHDQKETTNYYLLRDVVGEMSTTEQLRKDTILFNLMQDVTINGQCLTLGDIDVVFQEAVNIGEEIFMNMAIITIKPKTTVQTEF